EPRRGPLLPERRVPPVAGLALGAGDRHGARPRGRARAAARVVAGIVAATLGSGGVDAASRPPSPGGGSVIHMECAVPVRASRGAAWRVLEGKVRDPERTISRVRSCEV